MNNDTPLYQLRKDMCEIGQRIWQKGFCAGNEGNHSVRIGGDRVLCTPTGISKGFLDPQDMCVVDMDGTQVEPNARGRKRTSEVKVHLAIYKCRDDIRAVIHSHPPHATAFAIAQVPVPEGIHPEAEVFLGKVQTAQYATPSRQDLPDSLTPLIGPETNSLLMGNHGSVSFSNSLIDAYYKLEILDAYCRILLLTKQVGKVNVLSRDKMRELLEVKQQFGLSDERSACVAEGCIGTDNEAFLATFDPATTASASCSCSGGPVQCSCPTFEPSATTGPDKMNDIFEATVRSITDQIVSRMR